MEADYSINRVATGLVCMVLVGVVIVGGIVRVGAVTSKVVPAMFLLYVLASLYIVLANYSVMPDVIRSIFSAAFGGEAIIGGGAGVSSSAGDYHRCETGGVFQ